MKKKVVVNNKIEKICTLTPMQEGMLFHNIVDNNTANYILQNVVRLKKSISDDIIKKVLKLLEIRYEVLRTAFVYEKIDKPKEIILKEREIEYSVIHADNDTSKEDIIKNDLERGFNLQKDTLLRVTKVIDSDEEFIIWTMHHIIVDGWCMQLLIQKFVDFSVKLIDGNSYEVLKEEVLREKNGEYQYSDYLKLISNKNHDEGKKYWKELLEDYDNITEYKPILKPTITYNE